MVYLFRISTLFETNGIAILPTKIKKFTVNNHLINHLSYTKKVEIIFEIRTYTGCINNMDN